MCKIRISGRYRKISIVNVHAPTNNKEEEEKDSLYEQLTSVFAEVPRCDIKIIIGDFNAKLGKEKEIEEVFGKNSKHSTTNENGIKLVEFALEQDRQIKSTMFDRKDIYKGTWVSPDGMSCNQVDPIVIERKNAKLFKDVKSRRGACGDTDHFMV